jgi:hypothetical protein
VARSHSRDENDIGDSMALSQRCNRLTVENQGFALFGLGKRERDIDKQILPYELEYLGQGKATKDTFGGREGRYGCSYF